MTSSTRATETRSRRPASAHAGMTFEKTSSHPTARRVFEQYLTQWTSLSAAAANKAEILEDWHESWVTARRQGRQGLLETQRGRAARQHGAAARARHPGPPLLHPQRRSREGARDAGAGAAAAAHGRARRAAHALTDGARLQALRTRCTIRGAAVRDLRGRHGPAPEALDPGDAQRGHLHALPVLLRRHGLEPAPALQRARRLLRPPPARDAHGARPPVCPTRARGRRRRHSPGSRCTPCRSPSAGESSPRAGCGTCWTAGASSTGR